MCAPLQAAAIWRGCKISAKQAFGDDFLGDVFLVNGFSRAMGDPHTEYTCSRDYHLFSKGPKRILSLDGGGVRGAISVAFLKRIEELLDERMGREVRLGDWFDLVGGTSTGAIIAGAVALGKRVDEVKNFYLERAPKAFATRWSVPYLQSKFDARALRIEIDDIVKKTTLDSDELITGLCIIAKRIDTGSPWILANNPLSKFWETSSKGTLANKDYTLSALVRASTAAPTFFDPEIIAITREPSQEPVEAIEKQLGELPLASRAWARVMTSSAMTRLRAIYGMISNKGPNKATHGLFIDGGVSPYNNPGMALLMLVSLEQFGIRWDLGTENLSVISIGTGTFRTKLSFNELGFAGPLRLAVQAMLSAIGDAQSLALTQLQWLGETSQPWEINSEIAGVEGNPPPGGKWFRFQRYDVGLEFEKLRHFGPHYLEADATRLQQMDRLDIIEELYDIGCKAAKEQILPEHLFGKPGGS